MLLKGTLKRISIHKQHTLNSVRFIRVGGGLISLMVPQRCDPSRSYSIATLFFLPLARWPRERVAEPPRPSLRKISRSRKFYPFLHRSARKKTGESDQSWRPPHTIFPFKFGLTTRSFSRGGVSKLKSNRDDLRKRDSPSKSGAGQIKFCLILVSR